ncbi:MAG: AraC family transcriptional regulator [Pseudopedobacter saltans]|uniref:AraC family transcriptional regulator n=1 Tax=Pseudopedobacter saltans TaxID=151895 RepID=A0A2W5EJU1_9SPHI|nr:MAG: AraC family transcriptional regulator [Pseudopedobacter saltans]
MNIIEQGKHFGENKDQLVVNEIIFNKATVFPSFEIPWHYHENAYFLYNISGFLNEVTKQKTLNISPGTLLFHHSQEPHYNEKIDKEFDFFHVELTPTWFKKYDVPQNIVEGSIELKEPTLKKVFSKLYIETSIRDNATEIAVDSLVLQAFSEIVRFQENENKIKPTWIKKAVEIINDEKYENLSLNGLATELNLHPVYLSRKFPEYFNLGFGEYMREKKIERATAILQSQSMNNAEIAYTCGFSDESHFLKTFKAKFGITPHQFRKIIRKS